jgi:hypothetical protein
VDPEAPPLGGQLYDCLRTTFPESWGSLIEPEEHEAFQAAPPFEQGMGMIWEKRDERAQLLITDMALYFCRFSLGAGTNAYSRLLTVLQGRKVEAAFATLNYDCLLELALNRAGLGVEYFLSGGGRGGAPVMKPHGSCNFVPAGLGQTIQMRNVRFSGGAYHQGPLNAIPPTEVASLYTAGPSMPPAVSLFSPGKPTPVGSDDIDRIRVHWETSVGEADFVVVVGARPVLADEHVWDPILSSSADVWHVGGTSGNDFEDYEKRLGRRFTKLAGTFEEGLRSLDVRLQILG